MKITELIVELEKAKKEHGDLTVKICGIELGETTLYHGGFEDMVSTIEKDFEVGMCFVLSAYVG